MQKSRAKIVTEVKQILHDLLNASPHDQKLKLSAYISEQLNYEYNYLSTLFSEDEEITIEKYFIQIKVEKVKELIDSGEQNLNDIAYQLGYSSPAHLANQFKAITDQTPSEYKLNNKNTTSASKKRNK